MRRTVRIEQGHCCSRCGKFLPSGLHVHHKLPVTTKPGVRLERLNLVTACPSCHNALEPRSGKPRLKEGCDLTGHPLSKDHPWNNPRGAGPK